MPSFAFDSPAAAIDAARAKLGTRESGPENAPLAEAVGRTLAVAPALDRDSPACDLSAMDGYAVRAADLPAAGGTLRVAGEAVAGAPPPDRVPGTAVRIFTGAPLPAGCDSVLRQERVIFEGDVIRRRDRGRDPLRPGTDVRRRGENGRAGDPLAEPGAAVTPALVAAAAACGLAALAVRRQTRVAVLITGEEVNPPADSPPPAAFATDGLPANGYGGNGYGGNGYGTNGYPTNGYGGNGYGGNGSATNGYGYGTSGDSTNGSAAHAALANGPAAGGRPAPWQVRDANGPAIAALLGRRSFLHVAPPVRVGDDPVSVTNTLRALLNDHDAVITTGGVSVGDRDAVPGAVAALGGRVLFHGLPVRPGKPVFAAAIDDPGGGPGGPGGGAGGGRLILGLPGNPVAALCAARRFGVPLLRHVAGLAGDEPVAEVETLGCADDRPLPLWRFRPVRLRTTAEGTRAEPLDGRGASDTVAAARSDGFVEVPPHAATAGRHAFYPW